MTLDEMRLNGPDRPLVSHALRLFGLVDSTIMRRYRCEQYDPSRFFLNMDYYVKYQRMYSKPRMRSIVDSRVLNALRGYDVQNKYIDLNPNSLYIPEQYVSNMARYFVASAGEDMSQVKRHAIRLRIRELLTHTTGLSGGSTFPLPLHDVIERVRNDLGTKSAGYPYSCKKGYAITNYSDLLSKRIGFFRNRNYPKGDGPFILGFLRTYEKGKMRAVFGYPLEAVCVESRYSKIIIDSIKDRYSILR